MNTAQLREFAKAIGQGTRPQRISRWTWELPQTLLGLLATTVLLGMGAVARCSAFHGAVVIETQRHGWGGLSLGGVLIVGQQPGDPGASGLVRHEYGHYLDSQRLGPLYLLLIGLPSVLSAYIATRFGWTHRRTFTEQRAERNAAQYFAGSKTA